VEVSDLGVGNRTPGILCALYEPPHSPDTHHTVSTPAVSRVWGREVPIDGVDGDLDLPAHPGLPAHDYH